jgi:hypothetical protein
MKKLIMVLGLMLLAVPIQAKADTAFDYTGLTSENINPLGWEPGGSGFLGGPLSNERLGLAQQFKINQETQMSFLNVTATVLPKQGTTIFDYRLYTDSSFTDGLGRSLLAPIPLQNSLALTSQPLSFTSTAAQENNGTTIQYNEQGAFNHDLKPGTYWLAEEGTGGAYVGTTQTYTGNTAQTPEPPIWVFFAGFTLFIIFKGRKYVA